MVKMVPKYQKYLRVRRGPRRDFTKLYRVSKSIPPHSANGKAGCAWNGWRTIRPPLSEEPPETASALSWTPGAQCLRAAEWKQMGSSLFQSVLRSCFRRTGAAAHNAEHGQRRQPQELENLLIVFLSPLLVPTPVNTGRGNPFPLFDGFDYVLPSFFWQAQNLARTQIVYICT